MTFQKPKTNTSTKQPSADQIKKIFEVVLKEFINQDERLKYGLEKVNENFEKSLNSQATYYYYLLSITTACIGFTISLTISQKFKTHDIILMISLLSWIISFVNGMMSVNRTNRAISTFSYWMLGEIHKSPEIIEENRKKAEKFTRENSRKSRHPLLYFLLGVILFMIWYVVKICTN